MCHNFWLIIAIKNALKFGPESEESEKSNRCCGVFTHPARTERVQLPLLVPRRHCGGPIVNGILQPVFTCPTMPFNSSLCLDLQVPCRSAWTVGGRGNSH